MSKKVWIWLVALLLLGGFAVWIYLEIQSRGGEGKEVKKKSGGAAVAVEAVMPLRTSIEDRRIFTGTLKPWSQFDIAPKIGGRLEAINFDVGDRVTGGSVIAKIEDIEYKQSVDQAEADLEIAKAQLRQAEIMLDLRRREYDRQISLNEKKATSQAQLESAETAFHSQEASHRMQNAEVKRREAILDAAQLKFSECTIAAEWPASDRARFIGARHVDQGALLASNEPIVSVAELDPLRAFIYVIERDYPYLGIDQPATLTTDAYPDREFQGKVARIAQLMQDTTRQAAVQLEIPNPELKLKPGMFVRVQLQFKSKENATVVPRNAVVKRNGKQGVFTLDVKGGKAHFVPVETGITAGERIEILSPELRDPVVTLGNHLLTDDVSVLVPKQFLPPQPQVTK